MLKMSGGGGGFGVSRCGHETIPPARQVAVAAYVNTFGAQEFTGYEYVRLQGRLEGTQLIEIE